jgi:hypothetical protein
MTRRNTILTAGLLLFLSATPAPAQDTYRDWHDFLVPDIGEVRPWMYTGVLHASEEQTDVPGRHYKSTRYDLDVSVPIMPTITDQRMALQFHAGMRDGKTGALMPSTGGAFPDRFYDLGLGAIYRWKLDGGKMAALNLSFSSPSDDPFDNGTTTVRAAGLLRVPRERNAWLYYIHYQSDREYARNIPLPGVGYLYRPSEKFSAVAGFPYATFHWDATPKYYVTGSYLALRKLSAEAGNHMSDWITGFVGWEWDNEAYVRKAATRDDDRLRLDEKRITGGFRFEFSPDVRADVLGGYAFDRFWYEGEEYSDRSFNRINIGDGPVFGLNLSARF